MIIKIEVKDNNVEQALRVLKRKLQRDGFFKIIKLKNTYEKPSEKPETRLNYCGKGSNANDMKYFVTQSHSDMIIVYQPK